MKLFSPFTQKVISVVQAVPQGRVVSYGQVAAYVGVPRAARQVGWTLRSLEDTVTIPWWRVVNNAGVLSIKGNMHNDKQIQKQLLEQEGIIIAPDYTFPIEQYRFRADERQLKAWQLSELYRKHVLQKYGL